LATRSLNGVFGVDVVTLNGGTATFDTKNAGVGKIVTATGLTIGGADAGNYVLSNSTATTTAEGDSRVADRLGYGGKQGLRYRRPQLRS